MNEPWFSVSFAWVPGAVLGCTCGLLGALAGMLAPRGIGRTPILAAFWMLFGLGVVCLVAGAGAWFIGQPYHVWYGLGLAGFIVTFVMGFNSPAIFRAYREAELRKMQARDIV